MQIKQQYMRSYPNPFEQMLRQQDSLGLSNEVADSIAILNKTYGKMIDSIWTPVAKYLAGLPEKYDLDEAYDRVRSAENQSLDQMAIYGPAAKLLLTPTSRFASCRRSSRCSSTTRRFGRSGRDARAADVAGSLAASTFMRTDTDRFGVEAL